MKKGKTISAIFSVLFGLIFLAGTTGVTFIIHSCPVCDDFSVTSGILLSPTEPEDHCCDAADRHSGSYPSNSLQISSCHFKIDRLRLTNFSPKFPLSVSLIADLQSLVDISEIYQTDNQIILPREHHNKHGGRYLITSNCQFIS